MDILKLYRSRWKQEVFNEQSISSYIIWVNYYVLYNRKDHLVNKQVDKIGSFLNGFKHVDTIDNEIFEKLNDILSSNPKISNFDSTVDEFILWEPYEMIEKARISKLAFGYPFKNLQINTDINNVVQLKTRVFFSDAKNVKNSIIYDLPLLLDLDLTGPIPSLVEEDFLSTEEAEKIIHEQWKDRDENYSR